jgi:hypothetical protein
LRVLPTIGIAASGAFSDGDYLNRYGFIADTIAADSKALPIGFARGGPMLQDNSEPWLNPQTQEAMTGIYRADGLTSPRWPEDILPPIDQALAAKGAALRHPICTMPRCHQSMRCCRHSANDQPNSRSATANMIR